MSETIDWKALAKPFPYEDLEWRIQRSGKKKNGNPWALVVPYVTNRAIMQRLDDVVGPENWQNEYRILSGGVLCGIMIRVGDEWVTKWDAAPETDIEAIKGAHSGAMKRAAVHWGMGRHLYELEPMFAHVGDKAKHWARLKDGSAFKWNPPDEEEMTKGRAPSPTKLKRDKPAEVPGEKMTEQQLKALEALKAEIEELSDDDDQAAKELVATVVALVKQYPVSAGFEQAGSLIKELSGFAGHLRKIKQPIYDHPEGFEFD